MGDRQREGISPVAIYAHAFALRFLWVALSGPVVALIMVPLVAVQSGDGQLYQGIDIFDFAVRIIISVSSGLLALLIPIIIFMDFQKKGSKIDWAELARRSRCMDRQDLWQPRKVWRVVEDCRQRNI